MKSVICLTPNPALDLSGTVNRLVPDEKSYVFDEVRSPGGNAINAARILKRLNVPVLATGFLGGSTGDEIKYLLDLERVKNKFIQIEGHSRICVSVSNKTNHHQTRLTFPGPHIAREEKDGLFNLIENLKMDSFLVIGGSLPPGFEVSDMVSVLRIAAARNVSCIVDSPGTVMRKLIPEMPFFIKPNLQEFRELTGTSVKIMAGIHKAARSLIRKVSYVCVSSVEGGAVLLTEERSYFGQIPKVEIRSSVGAGDSMVGAMTAQFFYGNRNEGDILRWGLAAAAATLETRGTAFGSGARIRDLYRKTEVHSIK